MKTFKDIKFFPHKMGDGYMGRLTIENGLTLSVVAGSYFYCSPKADLIAADKYESYEIGIFDENDDWTTMDVLGNIGDDVLGWQSKEEIDSIIEKMYNHKPKKKEKSI